jgi:hypothetical protein
MSRFDRDATGRAIAVARSFGTRGRVVTPSDDLGPKGDLNDWLRVGAKGDASAFRSLLEEGSRRARPLGASRSKGWHRTWPLGSRGPSQCVQSPCELGHQIL